MVESSEQYYSRVRSFLGDIGHGLEDLVDLCVILDSPGESGQQNCPLLPVSLDI